MNTLTITPLNLEKDIPIINSWNETFKNHPNIESINHFILEDNTYYGLNEVI